MDQKIQRNPPAFRKDHKFLLEFMNDLFAELDIFSASESASERVMNE